MFLVVRIFYYQFIERWGKKKKTYYYWKSVTFARKWMPLLSDENKSTLFVAPHYQEPPTWRISYRQIWISSSSFAPLPHIRFPQHRNCGRMSAVWLIQLPGSVSSKYYFLLAPHTITITSLWNLNISAFQGVVKFIYSAIKINNNRSNYFLRRCRW